MSRISGDDFDPDVQRALAEADKIFRKRQAELARQSELLNRTGCDPFMVLIVAVVIALGLGWWSLVTHGVSKTLEVLE